MDKLLVNRKLTGNIESGSEDDGTNITEICKKKILVARNNLSLEDVAFHSLVMAFLIQENLQHTLSVYKFECGVRKKPLSEEECLQALGIQPNSTSFQRIFSHKEKSYKIEKPPNKVKEDYHVKNDTCILRNMVLMLIDILTLPMSPKHSIATQTMVSDPSEKARNQLNFQLERLRDTYKERLEKERTSSNPASSLQVSKEQLLFQSKCEEKIREESQRDLKRFKDNLLIATKMEEATKYKQQLRLIRSELKADYDLWTQKMKDDFDRQKQEVYRKQREFERDVFERRQKLIRELDDIKKREIECKKYVHERDHFFAKEEARITKLAKEAELKLNDVLDKEEELKNKTAADCHRAIEEANKLYEDAKQSAINQREESKMQMKRLHGESKSPSCQCR